MLARELEVEVLFMSAPPDDADDVGYVSDEGDEELAASLAGPTGGVGVVAAAAVSPA